jgi:hypothetical protein
MGPQETKTSLKENRKKGKSILNKTQEKGKIFYITK